MLGVSFPNRQAPAQALGRSVVVPAGRHCRQSVLAARTHPYGQQKYSSIPQKDFIFWLCSQSHQWDPKAQGFKERGNATNEHQVSRGREGWCRGRAGLGSPGSSCSNCTPAPLPLSPGFASLKGWLKQRSAAGTAGREAQTGALAIEHGHG